MEIKREKYLDDLTSRMHNNMVKVITGVRRCGKTFLLFNTFRDYLRNKGVDDAHVIELALDDEENASYRDPTILSQYLRSRISDDGKMHYILIDEVQYAISDEELKSDNPPRFYGVLNGLLRLRNVDIYVTGSNSKMLSTDVLTQFRGRGDEVRVRPFSFAEYMEGYAGDVYQGWSEYVTYGGMPVILSMKTDEQKARYLENLFAETYLRDIVSRNKLTKTQELEDLVDILASNIGALTNPSKIQATFKSVLRSTISSNTITSYIGYLKEAFLVEDAKRYDVKGRKHIGSPLKYYFVDMGLRNVRLRFRQVEQTHIMENIVYNELRMRGYSVDIGVVEKRGKDNGKDYRKWLEVDFVANLGSNRVYIQSALQLPDTEKITQETASLNEVGDNFKKIVLVRDVIQANHDDNGILFMSIYDFLLNADSLDW
jgi:predicted AAA+ superfamily ATPase